MSEYDQEKIDQSEVPEEIRDVVAAHLMQAAAQGCTCGPKIQVAPPQTFEDRRTIPVNVFHHPDCPAWTSINAQGN